MPNSIQPVVFGGCVGRRQEQQVRIMMPDILDNLLRGPVVRLELHERFATAISS